MPQLFSATTLASLVPGSEGLGFKSRSGGTLKIARKGSRRDEMVGVSFRNGSQSIPCSAKSPLDGAPFLNFESTTFTAMCTFGRWGSKKSTNTLSIHRHRSSRTLLVSCYCCLFFWKTTAQTQGVEIPFLQLCPMNRGHHTDHSLQHFLFFLI